MFTLNYQTACKVDLEAEDQVQNQVSEGTSCLLTYMVRFFKGEQGGGSSSLALDVQGAGELLCVIPGSDFGALVRRRAVDALLRVEGGDESLIDRIKANRKFQEYLRQHDPNHPLRAIGEYAEQRQAEEAIPEAHRREEMELALGHKKRMLELEFEDKKAELAAKKARFEQDAEAARLAIETTKKRAQQEEQQKQDEIHEEFRRQRASTITANLEALKVLLPNQQPLSPRSMRAVQDELRTGLLGRERPDASLGKPVYCSRFLQEQLCLRDWAARERAKVFGNDVKTAMRAMFPDYDIDARTNRSVDGHDREPHLYFETHLPAFFAALPKYVARAAEVKDDELTREGLQKKRAGSEESMRSFFRPR